MVQPAGNRLVTEGALADRNSPPRMTLNSVYSYKVFFNASDYGAKGDGVTDDLAALQACANDVAAKKGGVVYLDKPGGIYNISGKLALPNLVGLMGLGSMNIGADSYTNPISTIKFTAMNACVVVGDGTQTCFAPFVGNFDIEGGNLGEQQGALKFDGVNEVYASRITVSNIAGHGVRYAQGQNGTYDQIRVLRSGRVYSGSDSHRLTGGTGGNLFTRLYARDTDANGNLMNITSDAGMYQPYPNGPAHNEIVHSIFETTFALNTPLRVDCGGINSFDSCAFVTADAIHNPTAITASGATVQAIDIPWIDFHSCWFVGTGNAISFTQPSGGTGRARVTVDGFSVFQTQSPLFKITDCSPTIHFEQQASYVISQPFVDLHGTASMVNCQKHTVTEHHYVYQSTPDPNAAQIVPFSISVFGEGQARWFITQDGSMGWGPGGSVYPNKILAQDSVYGMKMTGGLQRNGMQARGQSAYTYGGGTQTVTIDATGPSIQRYAWTVAGSPTFVITNPQDGVDLTLVFFVSSSAIIPSWPTNIWFKNNTPPDLAPNTVTVLNLHFDVALDTPNGGVWVEVGRSVVSVTNTALVEHLATGAKIDNGLTVSGGINLSGRQIVPAPNWTYCGGIQTLTIDASTSKWFKYAWTAGGTPTFVISNPADGAEISVLLSVGVNAMSPVTWPTTVYWKNNQPPALAINTVTAVHLRYDSAFAAWVEIGRSVDSTTGVNLVEQAPSGLNVANGLTVAGGSTLNGGVNLGGRYVTTQTAWVAASGTTTYTLDTTLQRYFRYSFAAGGTPTFSMINQVDGEEISIQISVAATALTNPVWAANVWFRNNAAPPLAPNTITTIHLKWDAALNAGAGAWAEIGRSVDSTNNTALVEQLPGGVNVSNGLTVAGGITHTGRSLVVAPNWVFAGGTQTLTLDTSTSRWFKYSWGGGGTPTFVFSNPSNGVEISLMLSMGATALTSVTWPAAIYWKNNQPPALAPNTVTVVHLRYDSTFGDWVETGRSVNSPNGTNLVEQLPTGANISNGLAVTGGVTLSGKTTYPAPTWVFGGGTATYTLDVSVQKHYRYAFTATSNPTFVFSNPVDGSELTLMLWVTAATTFTWPAGIYWQGGVPPVGVLNAATTIHLRYDSTFAAWVEVARDVAATSPKAANVTWTSPTPGTGSNAGAGFPPVGYAQTAEGTVHLRGHLLSLALNTTIMTLPVGSRPSVLMRYPVWTYDGVNSVLGYLDIGTDGTVKLSGGAVAQLTLNGISFLAEA